MNNKHEMQVKIVFTDWMLRRYGPSEVQLIVNEFASNNSTVRADLMAIIGTDLVAVEIKSANDKLTRLNRQIRYLKLMYNRVEIVVSDRHLDNTKVLCKKEGVGLHVIKDGGVTTVLKGRRRAISHFHLADTLFPKKMRTLTDFNPDEEQYKSFLLKKYHSCRIHLEDLSKNSREISNDFIRQLNPSFSRKTDLTEKKRSYVLELLQSLENIQSVHSSSKSSSDTSCP